MSATKTQNIKRILVTQPRPTEENSPYFTLASKWKLEIDFRKFIEVQRVSLNDFRKQGINPLTFTAIVFTSKTAVDYFFSLMQEMRVELSPEVKYFCVGEATSKYMHKYITIRKRKLFVGEKTAMDLVPFLKKHKKEKFLFPGSTLARNELTDFMREQAMDVTEAVIYETVSCDVSDLEIKKYDMLCFFSPIGIQTLYKNFPDFEQDTTKIAVFGPTTAKEASARGLTVQVEAPKANMPSMTAAIEAFLTEQKGK